MAFCIEGFNCKILNVFYSESTMYVPAPTSMPHRRNVFLPPGGSPRVSYLILGLVRWLLRVCFLLFLMRKGDSNGAVHIARKAFHSKRKRSRSTHVQPAVPIWDRAGQSILQITWKPIGFQGPILHGIGTEAPNDELKSP